MMRLFLLTVWLTSFLGGRSAAAGFEGLQPRTPKDPGPQAAAEPKPKETVGTTATAPPPAAKPVAEAARGNVSIKADGGFEYDGESGRIIYRQKVLVLDPETDPRTTIACDYLTTVLPPPGGKIGEIIAMTNVVITIKDGKGLQVVKGSKAVYNATNDVVVITGNPIVDMPSAILYGDQEVTYRRATETFEAPGKIRMVAKPGGKNSLNDLLRGTNAAPKTPAVPPSPAATPTKSK